MDPRFITPLNNQSSPSRGDLLSKFYGKDLIDYISVLKERNAQVWQLRYVPGTLPSLMLPTGVVTLIFRLCSLFSQSSEVKYIAMEVFDRFVTRHFCEISEHVTSSSQNPGTVKKKWKLTVKRVQKQMLLRILSSIQIASKMDRQQKFVTVKMVQGFLTKAGLPYHVGSILNSEMRIFKTLDYQVPFLSPMTFLQTILEGLQSWANIDALIPVCEKVLNATLLQREEVYMRFFSMGTNRWERSHAERIECAAVESDSFLLGSAVVLAALKVHPLPELGMKKTSGILWDLTDTSQKDIEALATVIISVIFGRKCNVLSAICK